MTSRQEYDPSVCCDFIRKTNDRKAVPLQPSSACTRGVLTDIRLGSFHKFAKLWCLEFHLGYHCDSALGLLERSAQYQVTICTKRQMQCSYRKEPCVASANGNSKTAQVCMQSGTVKNSLHGSTTACKLSRCSSDTSIRPKFVHSWACSTYYACRRSKV